MPSGSIGAERKVSPEELTEGFQRIGLREGDSVMMHASLGSFGTVDGGAAMVLHRLLGVIGKEGTLMMPTFTYVTTHGNTHDNHSKPGCWCEGREDRHLPFIPELQPDKKIGEIAQRLCSWPSSRRSRHPAYSFVAVGSRTDELVREHPLMNPLQPIKKMQKYNPYVLMIGVGLDSSTAIHLAEELKTPTKFVKKRTLTFTSKGQVWVEVLGLGCSNGFVKIKKHLPQDAGRELTIGMAHVELHPMKSLIQSAEVLLDKDPIALACENNACLSCGLAAQPC